MKNNPRLAFFTSCSRSLTVFIVVVVLSVLSSELVKRTNSKRLAKNICVQSIILMVQLCSVLYSGLEIALAVETREVFADSVAVKAVIIAIFSCVVVIEVLFVMVTIANIVSKLPHKTRKDIRKMLNNAVPVIEKLIQRGYNVLIAL